MLYVSTDFKTARVKAKFSSLLFLIIEESSAKTI